MRSWPTAPLPQGSCRNRQLCRLRKNSSNDAGTHAQYHIEITLADGQLHDFLRVHQLSTANPRNAMVTP